MDIYQCSCDYAPTNQIFHLIVCYTNIDKSEASRLRQASVLLWVLVGIDSYKPQSMLLELATVILAQKTMKNDFVSSARSVSDMKAHLVLTTKYRRKVLTGLMINRLKDVVNDLCVKWDCKVIEFNGEDNHIHLLFQYYPQLELPKFIGNIKSVTSRRLRQEFPEEINKVYWKKVLWNESYFIASCGGVTISVLKDYIENQEKPQ